MKRVFIIHGWSGSPQQGWYPWLKKELEKKGFKVLVPELPNADYPIVKEWVSVLENSIDDPSEDLFLVGHSMGCQTIARYLEKLPEDKKVGGAIFVGGYFKRLTNLIENEPETWEKWKNTPVDLVKVRMHLPKSVAIFSDDDPYVPSDNIVDFKDRLKSEIIMVRGMKHFTQDDGFYELPIVLEKLLEIAQ